MYEFICFLIPSEHCKRYSEECSRCSGHWWSWVQSFSHSIGSVE